MNQVKCLDNEGRWCFVSGIVIGNSKYKPIMTVCSKYKPAGASHCLLTLKQDESIALADWAIEMLRADDRIKSVDVLNR